MPRLKMIYLGACFAAWSGSSVLSACSAQETERKAQPSQAADTLVLSGPINAASLRQLKEKLSPQTKRLVVNSAGGRGPEAIELGSLVRGHNLEVVVDGICLSACAHFVFLPARTKRVEPNSVVAFHQTGTALADVLAASGRHDLARVYGRFAEPEQAFYKTAGISRSVLVEPFSQILPICYREMEGVPADSEYRTAVFTRFTFYVPSLADLYGQGVGKISGYWPTSPSDVERALSRYPRKLNASFKMKLRSGAGDGVGEPEAVSVCPDDPAYRLQRGAPGSR